MELQKSFKWRTQNQVYIAPEDMQTRHLFYTLRMIYNHSMPPSFRLLPYKEYYFDKSIYTKSYITQAIRSLAYELATRKDITPEWNADLMRMFQACNLDMVRLKQGKHY